jgi:hypothetical protein
MAARAEVLSTGAAFDKRRAERIFYTAMSIAILITVFAGFSRTFFSPTVLSNSAAAAAAYRSRNYLFGVDCVVRDADHAHCSLASPVE